MAQNGATLDWEVKEISIFGLESIVWRRGSTETPGKVGQQQVQSEGWAWKGEKTMGINVTALEWDEAEQKNVLQNFFIQTFLDSKRNKEEAWIQWSYLSLNEFFSLL